MSYFNIHQDSPKDLSEFIRTHFSASYMSNAKWDKLIQALTDELDEVHLKFKLIYSDTLNFTSFDQPDFSPFFMEPIMYKEVEWIEFTSTYENYVNPNNLKAGKKTCQQDLKTIRSILEKAGKFQADYTTVYIRLYAYKRV